MAYSESYSVGYRPAGKQGWCVCAAGGRGDDVRCEKEEVRGDKKD